jgi:peptidoglycan hydrolase FlgJ
VIDKVNSGFPLTDASSRISSPRIKDSPEKIKKAAEQFEALLIGQMLKSAREAGSSGGLGTGEDNAGQTGMEMAEQQFAGLLASKGGLGLSRFITSNLERSSG